MTRYKCTELILSLRRSVQLHRNISECIHTGILFITTARTHLYCLQCIHTKSRSNSTRKDTNEKKYTFYKYMSIKITINRGTKFAQVNLFTAYKAKSNQDLTPCYVLLLSA